jgi:hypothetical protein
MNDVDDRECTTRPVAPKQLLEKCVVMKDIDKNVKVTVTTPIKLKFTI